MGMPRHIGHSDEEWESYLKTIDSFLSLDLSAASESRNVVRYHISDIMFSVGQKAYMAGYNAAVREVSEAARNGRLRPRSV